MFIIYPCPGTPRTPGIEIYPCPGTPIVQLVFICILVLAFLVLLVLMVFILVFIFNSVLALLKLVLLVQLVVGSHGTLRSPQLLLEPPSTLGTP